MHRSDLNNLKPCSHMETLVSAWVDGKLTGLLHWYAQWHVAHCSRCTEAVPVLHTLRARLRRLEAEPIAGPDSLPADRLEAVHSAWEQADSGSPPG